MRAADTPKISSILENAEKTILEGQETFRFDMFGDEAFWGDTLRLHQALEGAKLGGVGTGLSPAMALALGLKVDSQALPPLRWLKFEPGKWT